MRFSAALLAIAFLILTGLRRAKAAPIGIGEAIDHGDYSTVTQTGLDLVDISLTYGISHNEVVAVELVRRRLAARVLGRGGDTLRGVRSESGREQ